MLATVPRAAPRAARRALTTATALRAPLAPPYAHANRSALAPPYTHPLVRDEDRLKAPYAFSVPRNSQTATGPSSREWVAAVFDTAAGREWAMSAWESALVELAEQVSWLCRGRVGPITITGWPPSCRHTPVRWW